jgi:hypothetical protein
VTSQTVLNRFGAVLAPGAAELSAGPGAAPPGIDQGEFRLAMLEDTYDMVAGLDLVSPALILNREEWPAAEAVTWPGTPVLRASDLGDTFARLQALGADQTVLVAADAPDLPPLLIGKLFRALGSSRSAGAHTAVCPAEGGGLVAVAVPLPVPEWLGDFDAGFHLFDLPDAFARLRAAAPRPGLVQAGPGWHRLRTAADLAFLDPGLEGWENTRALLAGRPL